MEQYLKLGADILENGNIRGDRTGTGTVSVFGRQFRFNLASGFPLLTTKKMFLKGIVHELLWFLQGDTNNNTLNAAGVGIWDEWAAEDGDLGPVYGKQWRSWQGKVIDIAAEPVGTIGDQMQFVGKPVRETFDQISELIHNLKNKPFSRRHVISAWNVEDLPDESISPQENVKKGKMALAPCHCLFQFYVQALTQQEIAAMIDAVGLGAQFAEASLNALSADMSGDKPGEATAYLERFLDENKLPKYKLSCQLYQRSADYAIGVPYNVASYALLTMMIAQCCNMLPGEFIHTFGDVHLYRNHLEKFSEQLTREPYQLPVMEINPNVTNIFDFKYEDFKLMDYKSHDKIDYEISV